MTPVDPWYPHLDLRHAMVHEQIERRGIHSPAVLKAMRTVPRHLFFGGDAQTAYTDFAQPIACGQTISQPYIVALMTEYLALTGSENVLEIGAGSGYQTAVLSLLCRRVVAIERHTELAQSAAHVLGQLRISNVDVHIADGSYGFAPGAPYDAILVAAAAPAVPPVLAAQLAPMGRMIIPVGPEGAMQRLVLVTKDAHGNRKDSFVADVAFVPLVGSAGYGLPDDLGMMDI